MLSESLYRLSVFTEVHYLNILIMREKTIALVFFSAKACYLFLVFFMFISCESEKKNIDQTKTFYDLRGFIEGQITDLSLEKPVVSKTMAIGKEKSQLSSKDIDWKKELELFIQADINKPAYKNSYKILRTDSVTYEYLVKANEKIPVQYLKIKLDRPRGLPVEIEALLKSENRLYKSEKKIGLLCSYTNEKAKIISYKIEGFQKLITMDEKPFKIEGSVKR